MLAGAVHSAFAGELNPYAYRLAVTPHPQEVHVHEKAVDGFRFDSDTSVHVMHAEDLPGANLLAGDVARRYGLDWQPGTGHLRGENGNAIWIARIGDEVELPHDATVVEEVTHPEGYSIVISW